MRSWQQIRPRKSRTRSQSQWFRFRFSEALTTAKKSRSVSFQTLFSGFEDDFAADDCHLAAGSLGFLLPGFHDVLRENGEIGHRRCGKPEKQPLRRSRSFHLIYFSVANRQLRLQNFETILTSGLDALPKF